MSNWEARQLSAKQVQYAALDAVITGTLYRGLRLWHASPSACTSCRQMLGAVSCRRHRLPRLLLHHLLPPCTPAAAVHCAMGGDERMPQNSHC